MTTSRRDEAQVFWAPPTDRRSGGQLMFVNIARRQKVASRPPPAEMSFRARGREIRSDGAVLAEHRLRQRRGGARRGRISFDKRETQMWGSEPVERDGRAAQTPYLASGGSDCSYFELYGQMLGPLASVRTLSKNRVSCSDSSVFRFFWSSRFCRYPSPPPIRPSFRPH